MKGDPGKQGGDCWGKINNKSKFTDPSTTDRYGEIITGCDSGRGGCAFGGCLLRAPFPRIEPYT